MGRKGEYREYYDNGQLREACNYIDGKIEGEYREYYDNGQLYIICNYIDGKREGEL